MDYRIAKQIRSTKFSDLIAANVVQGSSIADSFKKALSQKAKARATRIKEKFDPLNIIKFMTGGSKLAPAILGRLLGRSQRDIEYFSGTARLIGGRNTRIGTVDKQGMELGILTDIFQFLNKSYEYDKKQRDSQIDYAEEREAEDERRHKQLLQAIQGRKTPYTPLVKKEEEETGGFLDMLKGMFEAFKKTVTALAIAAVTKLFGGLKVIGNILSFLGSEAFKFLGSAMFRNLLKFLGSRVFGLLLGPLAVAGTIIGLVLLLARAIKMAIGQLPDFENSISQEDALNYLQTASERDIEALSQSFRGGRAALEAKAVGGVENARMVLESGNEEQIKKYGGRELLERVAAGAPSTDEKKAPKRPKSGVKGITSLAQRNWDEKYGGKFDPLTGKRLTEEEMVLPEQIREPPQSVSTSGAEPPPPPKIGQYNRVRGASISPMQGVRSDVAEVSALNRNLNMESNMAQQTPNIDKSVEMRPRNTTTDALRIMPPVRNMDDTFQRMIYNSIRVV